MKKAIYINCWQEPWVDVAHELEKQYDIHPCIWIGYSSMDNSDVIVPKEFPDVMYIDNLDAWMGRFPEKINKMAADYYLDIDYLRKHSDHELQAIKMMDRVDHDLYSFNFMERQRHYRNMIKQWMAVIEELKPDLIIATEIPHRLYDYVLFWLCQEYNIPYIILTWTSFPNRCMASLNQFYVLEDMFVNDWLNFEKSYNNEELEKIIAPDILDYYNKNKIKSNQSAALKYMESREWQIHFKSPLRIALPYVIRILAGRYSLKSIFKSAKFEELGYVYFAKNKKCQYERNNNSILGCIRSRVIKRQLLKALYCYYENIAEVPDYSKKYVCVFLHFQPEAASCPAGDIFVDQKLCIELLLKNLPESYDIYVKEHPHQFVPYYESQTGKMKDFYDDLKKYSRVKIISTKVDSWELIKNAEAISTIVGTAGWQAICLQKPIIVFGFSWYSNYSKGVLRITNEESANKIAQFIREYKYDEHSLLAYLASVTKNTYLAAYFRNGEGYDMVVPREESIKNLFLAIKDKIIEAKL